MAKGKVNPPSKPIHARTRAQDDDAPPQDTTIERVSPTTDVALMEALQRSYSPESIIDEIDALAQATVTYVTKDGREFSKPDFSTRLRAVELKIAYLIGKPIERQEVIQHRAPSTLADLEAKAAKSPVFKAGLKKLLAKLLKDDESA